MPATGRSVMPSAARPRKSGSVELRLHTVESCSTTRRSISWVRNSFCSPGKSCHGARERPRMKVVVFESAVDGFFLNHSDFLAKIEDLTAIPQGPTGLEAWPDILVRLTRAPVVSIAKIRGRATGNGSELLLACDMSFVSREKAVLVAVGSRRGPRRGWRTHGALAAADGTGPRPRSAAQLGRHPRRRRDSSAT